VSDPSDPAEKVADSAESLAKFDASGDVDMKTELDAPADVDVGTEFDTADETDRFGSELEATEADTELKVLFGRLVLLYKLSMLGTTLGVLLFLFDRGPDVGVELLAGGLVLLAYSLYETKCGKDRVESGEFHGEET